SVEEACVMSGRNDVHDAAKFFLDRGAGTCLFTMGEEGSFVATTDTAFRIPAFDVDVVDTTGCGDAYCGGFIAALSHGWDLEQCARFATATSALVATG